MASARDEAYFRESCARLVAGREAMTRELIRLGFAVLLSSANFVFARHPAKGGSEFSAALREHAILVRHFNKPRTAPYLRITVGTEHDTQRLKVDDLGTDQRLWQLTVNRRHVGEQFLRNDNKVALMFFGRPRL